MNEYEGDDTTISNDMVQVLKSMHNDSYNNDVILQSSVLE